MEDINEAVKSAKRAIQNGKTRGRFIREATEGGADWIELQEWSDAYSIAMEELRSN